MIQHAPNPNWRWGESRLRPGKFGWIYTGQLYPASMSWKFQAQPQPVNNTHDR